MCPLVMQVPSSGCMPSASLSLVAPNWDDDIQSVSTSLVAPDIKSLCTTNPDTDGSASLLHCSLALCTLSLNDVLDPPYCSSAVPLRMDALASCHDTISYSVGVVSTCNACKIGHQVGMVCFSISASFLSYANLSCSIKWSCLFVRNRMKRDMDGPAPSRPIKIMDEKAVALVIPT